MPYLVKNNEKFPYNLGAFNVSGEKSAYKIKNEYFFFLVNSVKGKKRKLITFKLAIKGSGSVMLRGKADKTRLRN
jgi:hypothetical protein